MIIRLTKADSYAIINLLKAVSFAAFFIVNCEVNYERKDH